MQIVKTRRCAAYTFLRVAAMIACALLALKPGTGRTQITPQEASELRATLGNRVEALTILGGDFGLSDGRYKSTESGEPLGNRPDSELSVTKIGGSGDVGDPQPLGNSGIGWQPRLQGNMGWLQSTNYLHGTLQSDVSKFRDFAIQFGGGVRLWVSDALSFAPTIMGMYGHTTDEYAANSAFMRTNLGLAKQLGLVDWRVNTWTVRPALDIQYVINWDRVIVTLSSDPTYFRTESFGGSNTGVTVSGDSGSLDNKIDIDIPLGIQLHGHELRTGGYVSRTELFGDLKTGLDVEHINELHTRLVMDYLNQFWKVQWLGIGTSYLWGPNFRGWSVSADVAFRF